MAKKAAKAKKPTTAKKPAAAKKAAKASHVPTPWPKLKQMWEAGESYEAMAKATDAHYQPQKPDPTKATRAKIWKARNVGVSIDGKLVKFGKRGTKAKEGGRKGKATKEAKRSKKTEGHPEKVKRVQAAKAKKMLLPTGAQEPAKNNVEGQE